MLIAGIAVGRLAVGSDWGLLSLLAVGPALAAAIGGVRYTLAAGAGALVVTALFLIDVRPGSVAHRAAIVVLFTVAGVTAAGMLASWARGHRDRQLAQVRLVAEAAQQVVLRPVPRQIGSLKFAVRYLSAASQARVGGDLYEVVAAGDRVRLVVGDAEGKGLPAVQSAAQVLGVFREAAHEEDSLTAIASRMETSLARRPGLGQFVTAILAEISQDGTKMELVSCGHPPPLLLGKSGPRLADCPPGLPLGLGDLSAEPRLSATIALEPGDEVLFYTDGATEARNKAGELFPLTDSDSVLPPHHPERLVDRLCAELVRYVGHAPDDDIALLLVYQETPLPVCRRQPGTASICARSSSRSKRPGEFHALVVAAGHIRSISICNSGRDLLLVIRHHHLANYDGIRLISAGNDVVVNRGAHARGGTRRGRGVRARD